VRRPAIEVGDVSILCHPRQCASRQRALQGPPDPNPDETVAGITPPSGMCRSCQSGSTSRPPGIDSAE
jgi:hypothetical protein